MTSLGVRGPVVVGVNGSAATLDVLAWAAAEAAARHSPLPVVHVFTWPAAVDPLGLVAGTSHRACQEAAEQVLDEAVTRARLVAPERRITPHLTIGPTGRALLEQSQDAGMLVLGHGSGRVRRLLRWSVDVHMVAHATCPVAVVSPFRIVPPGPSAARVVVGVDSSTQSSAAIGYAYQAAAQRGIGLTAVHAWNPRGAVDIEGMIDDVGAAEETERRVLEQALDGWTRQFLGVSIQARLVRGCPARALITESAGAALTVVGSGNRKGVRRIMLGQMSQLLIRSAYSPVAVLRPQP
jgi:nucleotide-binding universal stress UspA family protein